MNEFLKDNTNIKNMHNMIKLLLLGTDDCLNFAGLLYGLTKDKKVGGELVSEIIYKAVIVTSCFILFPEKFILFK